MSPKVADRLVKDPLQVLLDIESIPEHLWVLTSEHHNNIYVMYVVAHAKPKARGLAVFSTSERALDFLKNVPTVNVLNASTTFAPSRVTFEEARQIAKSKEGVNSVLLLDNVVEPVIHYIR